MKTPNRKARSAAQVAMSKTNPAKPEEATDRPQPRVISGPPRFDQQPGAIGSVCRHCGESIRNHQPGTGFCNPDDATQIAAEQELEEAQAMRQVEEDITVREEQEQIAKEQAAGAFRDEGFDHSPIIEDTQTLEPLPGSRLVDQALEIINLLPDCPEREILLRRCALAVSHQMNIAGFMLEEEME